jgi:hypothetical protein
MHAVAVRARGGTAVAAPRLRSAGCWLAAQTADQVVASLQSGRFVGGRRAQPLRGHQEVGSGLGLERESGHDHVVTALSPIHQAGAGQAAGQQDEVILNLGY